MGSGESIFWIFGGTFSESIVGGSFREILLAELFLFYPLPLTLHTQRMRHTRTLKQLHTLLFISVICSYQGTCCTKSGTRITHAVPFVIELAFHSHTSEAVSRSLSGWGIERETLLITRRSRSLNYSINKNKTQTV